MVKTRLRYDWTIREITTIYNLSFPTLILTAQAAHHSYHKPSEVQACSLVSIKTGGCPEDCAYCPQSARYQTGIERSDLLSVDETLTRARRAQAQGATRFCMGAAWRDAPTGRNFEQILKMVRGVRELGLEACCTLGMLTENQAYELADAGLTAYNHNLDTSPEFYPHIISTRTYDERLRTLDFVRRAGITVCCGGIIGMGESRADRYSLLRQLATQRPHPESVPINLLVRVAGTPLANQLPVDPLELVRTIATARIVMPKSIVRLSAGRAFLSDEAQALCFVAGANSIFIGQQLLTTPNPECDSDRKLLTRLGMRLSKTRRTEPAEGDTILDHAFELRSEVM